MKSEEFDTLVKAKFNSADFEYNQDNWKRLSWRLDNLETKNGKSIWMTIAFAMASSLTLFAAIIFYNPERETKPMSYNSKQLLKGKTLQMQTHLKPITNGITFTEPRYTTKKSYISKTIIASIDKPTAIKENTGKVENVNIDKESSGKNDIVLARETQSKKINLNSSIAGQDAYEPKTLLNSKIKLSFGGGYNFGAAEGGYMLSATASKGLGKRLYLEGSLALVNNATTNSTKSNSSRYDNFSPSINNEPGSGVSRIEDKETVSVNSLNLYYVQVTPVLGYKVHKKISLGVGADIQRVLQDKYAYVRKENGEVFAIPGIDLGMLVKAEYKLADRVSTGVAYRNGISNVLDKSKHYLDRDYLQVQLKFSISK